MGEALEAMLAVLEREHQQAERLSTAADQRGRVALHLAIAAQDVGLVRRLVDAVSALRAAGMRGTGQ